MGLQRGFKANYYGQKKNTYLEQYLNASDLLTINDSQKLKKKVEELSEKNQDKDYVNKKANYKKRMNK